MAEALQVVLGGGEGGGCFGHAGGVGCGWLRGIIKAWPGGMGMGGSGFKLERG